MKWLTERKYLKYIGKPDPLYWNIKSLNVLHSQWYDDIAMQLNPIIELKGETMEKKHAFEVGDKVRVVSIDTRRESYQGDEFFNDKIGCVGKDYTVEKRGGK